MEVLLSFLPLAGCAVMMALCIGLMGGARRRRNRAEPDPEVASTEEVAALRQEVARLRAERAEDARRVDG